MNGTRTETRAGQCEIKKQNSGLLDEVFFSCEPVIEINQETAGEAALKFMLTYADTGTCSSRDKAEFMTESLIAKQIGEKKIYLSIALPILISVF